MNARACTRRQLLTATSGLALTSLFGCASMNANMNANPKLDAALQAIVNDAQRPLASLAVLAIRGGEVVYKNAFGHRWIHPTDPSKSIPANSASLYRIASISKLITSLGVLRLVEEGKIDLDKDISEYLGFSARNPKFPGVPVTSRMLMIHTSSLRDDAGYYWDYKQGVSLKDVLQPGGKLFGEGKAWASNAAPGAFFQYCNFAWGVLGTVMERATGERFDKLMRRVLLDPMNLPGGFSPADIPASDLANIATLYRKRSEVNGREVWDLKGPWVPQVDDYSKSPPTIRADDGYPIGTNGTLFGPQGNCRLSAEGLGAILLMLMNGGTHHGKQILSKVSIAELTKTQWKHEVSKANGEPNFGGPNLLFNAWGLGAQRFLDISEKGKGDRLVEGGGFTAFGHLGDAWGLTSAAVYDPVRKHGLVYLIGGPGFNPDTNPGAFSGLHRHEEQILTALWRQAVAA
jgi:CubicO group peptidase (beta-lactamase class C family)